MSLLFAITTSGIDKLRSAANSSSSSTSSSGASNGSRRSKELKTSGKFQSESQTKFVDAKTAQSELLELKLLHQLATANEPVTTWSELYGSVVTNPEYGFLSEDQVLALLAKMVDEGLVAMQLVPLPPLPLDFHTYLEFAPTSSQSSQSSESNRFANPFYYNDEPNDSYNSYDDYDSCDSCGGD